MDWPVIGAFAGVSAVAGMVGLGAVAVWTSDSPAANIDAPVIALEQTQSPTTSAPAYLAIPGPTMPRYAARDMSRKTSVRRDAPDQPRKEAAASANLDPAETRDLHARESTGALHQSAAPLPVRRPADREEAIADPRYARVLTPAKIARLRTMLRLLPNQSQLWPAVEAGLRRIGYAQITQLKHGAAPNVDQRLVMDLYWKAQPLLGSLYPEQKETVRALARSLGYANVAAML